MNDRQLLQELWPEFARSANVALGGSDYSPAGWAVAREAFYEIYGNIPIPSADSERLAALRNRYRGERIFLIGNGPSLASTPLEFLENEFTFGVNRIYLMEDALGFAPSFFTVVDWRVAADCADEISALVDRTMFLPERFRGLLNSDADDVYWYHHNGHTDQRRAHFSPDASEGIRGAGSVIGSAVQLAFHMGFDPIYLVGCDLTYTVPKSVVQSGPDNFGTGVRLHLESTQDDDPNHFDPRYFGAGRKWHDPNVPRMLEGYAACQEGVVSRGRTLFNATVGGKLESSPRVDVHALLRSMTDVSHESSLPAHLKLLEVLTGEGIAATEPTTLVCGGHDCGVVDALSEVGGVYVFEPSSDVRRALRAAVGSRPGLRIDARFIGPRSSAAIKAYRDRNREALSSVALSDNSEAVASIAMATIAEVCETRRVPVPTAAWIGCGANTFDALQQCAMLDGIEFVVVERGTGTGPEFGSAEASLTEFVATTGLHAATASEGPDGSLVVTRGLVSDEVPEELVKCWVFATESVIDGLLRHQPMLPRPARPREPHRQFLLHTMAASESADQLKRLAGQ